MGSFRGSGPICLCILEHQPTPLFGMAWVSGMMVEAAGFLPV